MNSAPSEHAPSPRRPLLKGVVVHAALWILLSSGALLGVFAVPPSPMLTLWDSASSLPPPDAFRVLMFPKGGRCDIVDGPEGRVVGSLERAMLNGLGELGSPFIAVRHQGVRGVVRASDVCSDVEPGAAQVLVRRMIDERRSRGGHDLRYSCTFSRSSATEPAITVCESVDDRRVCSSYLLRNGMAIPVRLEHESAMANVGRGLAIGSIVLVWLGATAALGISLLVCLQRIRRSGRLERARRGIAEHLSGPSR